MEGTAEMENQVVKSLSLVATEQRGQCLSTSQFLW